MARDYDKGLLATWMLLINGVRDTSSAYPKQHTKLTVCKWTNKYWVTRTILDGRLKLSGHICWRLAMLEWSSPPVLAADNRRWPQDSENRPLLSLAYCTQTFPMALCWANHFLPVSRAPQCLCSVAWETESVVSPVHRRQVPAVTVWSSRTLAGPGSQLDATGSSSKHTFVTQRVTSPNCT